MGKVGKRTKKAMEAFSGKSNVSIEEAVKLVKSNATAKFDETIEIAMNLGVDTRHADQMVRGVVGLPNGTGKSTLLGLLAGVFYPSNGSIFARSEKLGFVGPNPLIFSASLRENIMYGNKILKSDTEILKKQYYKAQHTFYCL